MNLAQSYGNRYSFDREKNMIKCVSMMVKFFFLTRLGVMTKLAVTIDKKGMKKICFFIAHGLDKNQ